MMLDSSPLLRKYAQRIRRMSFRKLRLLRIKTDEPSFNLAEWQRNDADRNAKTTPPADEYIDICCIWAVEFYTPSHFGKLEEALRTLGWHERSTTSESRIDWLHSLRFRQQGGSWIRLDSGLQEESTGFYESFKDLRSEGVRIHSGYLLSISPSLVGILVCFYLQSDSTYATIFDKSLRKHYKTYYTKTNSAYAIHDPESQKRENVRLARNIVPGLAQDWLRQNIPGVFASNLVGGAMPTFELTTFRKAEPYPRLSETGQTFTRYLLALDMHTDFHSWASREIPGLKFRMTSHSSVERNSTCHSVLAIRESDLIDAMPATGWSRESRWSRVAYLDMTLMEMLYMSAVFSILAGYTQYINSIFGSSEFRGLAQRHPSRMLSVLEKYVLFSSDLLAVAADLVDSEQRFQWLRPSGDFIRHFDLGEDSEVVNMSKEFAVALAREAKWIQDRDQAIRDHLAQYAAVLGASENVRLQNRLGCLTLVLVFLTIALIILAIVELPLEQWLSSVERWIPRFHWFSWKVT